MKFSEIANRLTGGNRGQTGLTLFSQFQSGKRQTFLSHVADHRPDFSDTFLSWLDFRGSWWLTSRIMLRSAVTRSK